MKYLHSPLTEKMSQFRDVKGSQIFEPKSMKGREQMKKLFLAAVIQSNIRKVRECLMKNVDPNTTTSDGDSALHLAAEKGDINLCNTLLASSKILINSTNERGTTPLMISVIFEHRYFTRALLQRGADPNVRDMNGNLALHFAVRNGNLGIVYDLCSFGAIVNNTENVFDETVLSLAILEHPNYEIAKYLLKKGARLKGTKAVPVVIETALNCNSLERLSLFDLLINYGEMDINRAHPLTQATCLHIVAMTGYEPLAIHLLENGANMELRDAMNRTPKMIAVEHNNLEIVGLLTNWNKPKKAKSVAFATSTSDLQ